MKYKGIIRGSIHYIVMTQEQVEKYFKAKEAGLEKVSINSAIVQVGSIHSFIPLDEALKQENDILKQKFMFRCHAGNLHHVHPSEAYNDKAWKCRCPKKIKQLELTSAQKEIKKQIEMS